MTKLIHELYDTLNRIKGFRAGYRSKVMDQMMIEYDGKRYMVTFEELCNTEDEGMFTTMNKYWR